MDSKKVINQVLLERGKNIEWLAEKIGIQTQSLRNKISRGNFSLKDFIQMMDLLECDLQVMTRDTKKIFD